MERPFQRQVRSHEEMVRHGHFLKYLHYFIYGAKLPAPAIQAFKAAVALATSTTAHSASRS
ncbi:hypothetical protein [Sphingopyxis solisilvae]|uniref:hypothetical protein n=1 Tax=Sphingopyxis solisilvae TaxID=1886788 RepID=UPI0018929506|nr:hypothetical protein [Sphingopyxis solisilvae]